MNFVSIMFFAMFLVAGLAYLYIGSYILYVNIHERVNQIFAFGTYSLAVWSLTYAMGTLAQDYANALFWRRVSSFGWGFFYALMLHFAIVLLRNSSITKKANRKHSYWIFFIYIPAFISVYVYGISFKTSSYYYKLTQTPFGWRYVTQNSIWDMIFNFYYIGYSIVFAVLMLMIIRRTRLIREKRQVVLIFAAFVFCFFVGSLTDIVFGYFTSLELPQSAILFFLIPVQATWYALRKYGSMEISISAISEDILVGMNEGLILMDAAGRIKNVNDYFASLTGFEKEKLIGKIPGEIFTWDKAPEETIWGEFLKEDKKGLEESIWISDGSCVPVMLSGKRIMNQWGDLMGAVCIMTDLSEVKRKEKELMETKLELEEALREAKSALEVKTQFLSNMSHEIRTPMNSIVGMSYLLGQTELQDQQEEYLKQLQRATNTLLSLVNNILDFSKIDSGAIGLQQIEFDFPGTVTKIYHTYRAIAREKQVNLSYRSEGAIPRKLFGDPFRLEQVLSNLLDNAVKFTNEGEVQIRMKVVDLEEEYIVLGFDIKDTGIGIAEKDQEKIFDVFTQIDGSRTRQYSGTGMGLAITKSLVKLMGGEIKVESKLGWGSVFSFTVRLGWKEEEGQIRLISEELEEEGNTASIAQSASTEFKKEILGLTIDLSKGESDAMDKFENLREALKAAMTPEDYNYLVLQISRYEFEAAHEKLTEIFFEDMD